MRSGPAEPVASTSQDLEQAWQEESTLLVPLDRSILQLPGGLAREKHGDANQAPGFFRSFFGGRGRKAKL